MTVMEMRLRFQEIVQEAYMGVMARENFIDSNTILKYLNDSQIKYIAEKYLSSGSLFERSAIVGNNLRDLNSLVKIVELDALNSSPYPNSLIAYSSSVDIWHYISVSMVTSRVAPTTHTKVLMDLTPIEATNLNRHLTTAVNRPLLMVPVYTFTVGDFSSARVKSSELLIVMDMYSSKDGDINTHCVIKPHKLVLESPGSKETTNCQLAEYLHDDIVRMAVALYDQDKFKLASKQEDTK